MFVRPSATQRLFRFLRGVHPRAIPQLREDQLIACIGRGKCQHRNDGCASVFEFSTAINNARDRENDIGRDSVQVRWNAPGQDQS
jgi:hypothetical protein